MRSVRSQRDRLTYVQTPGRTVGMVGALMVSIAAPSSTSSTMLGSKPSVALRRGRVRLEAASVALALAPLVSVSSDTPFADSTGWRVGCVTAAATAAIARALRSALAPKTSRVPSSWASSTEGTMVPLAETLNDLAPLLSRSPSSSAHKSEKQCSSLPMAASAGVQPPCSTIRPWLTHAVKCCRGSKRCMPTGSWRQRMPSGYSVSSMWMSFMHAASTSSQPPMTNMLPPRVEGTAAWKPRAVGACPSVSTNSHCSPPASPPFRSSTQRSLRAARCRRWPRSSWP
mmetsp:Transcript_73082/g.219426  ORF Transcript_73082/g.219426 Transcript_73082/m.219426 type:complete len:285 (-) Transcript_73082:339-1193(-)